MNKSLEKAKEYKNLYDNLNDINVNRGASPQNNKGFYGEEINATLNNIDNINKGIKARHSVLDSNDPRVDTVVKYSNGQTGRVIQEKMGYSPSALKSFVESGKYDNTNLVVNPNHPIFKNNKALQALKAECKKHNIILKKGQCDSGAAFRYANNARNEELLKTKLGLKADHKLSSAGTVAELAVTKEISDITNQIQQKGQTISDNINEFTSKYLGDLNEIHKNSAKAGMHAAALTAGLSVATNLYKVVNDGEDISTALVNVAYDSATAGCKYYVTEAIAGITATSIGQTSLVLNTTAMVVREMGAFLNDEIDAEKFISNIAESTVKIAASYICGTMGNLLLPGVGYVIGSIIGEQIVSTVCCEITRICANEKHNKKVISLYNKANREIKESQKRLKKIIDEENNSLINEINKGFESIYKGIQAGDYDDVMLGIEVIGAKFGLSKQELHSDFVTKDNIFKLSNEVLLIE